LEDLEIGKSGPIDADGNGPQGAKQASSMNTEREGAVCELIEVMQILLGSSVDAGAYKCVIVILQPDCLVTRICHLHMR
jgi:hypothetical protein